MKTPDSLKVLHSAEEVRARVEVLGAEIAKDYADKDVVVVAVLRGACIFLADLARAMPLPLTIDFLGVSSYGAGTETSGVVRLTQDLSKPIAGKHVIIIEDIVDTGLTLKYILENFQTRHPASVEVAALLDKPSGRRTEVPVRYVGFSIPNHFVVGYGLDLDQRYRNLPYIGYFDPPEEAALPGHL